MAIIGTRISQFYNQLKDVLNKLWNKQIPRLVYIDGVLNENSIIFIIKTLRKNLRFSILEETKQFIIERKKYFHTDKEAYYKIIDNHFKHIEEIEIKIISETLESFGINNEEFNLSLSFYKGNENIAKVFRRISTAKNPIADEFSCNASIISTIMWSKHIHEEIKKLQPDQITEYTLYEIYDKYDTMNELEFGRMKKIFKENLSILDLDKVIVEVK